MEGVPLIPCRQLYTTVLGTNIVNLKALILSERLGKYNGSVAMDGANSGHKVESLHTDNLNYFGMWPDLTHSKIHNDQLWADSLRALRAGHGQFC